MSQSSQSSQYSQSEPYVGTLKVYLIKSDESKLNFIFCSDQEHGLQHLKVADKSKGLKLKVNNWYKLRGFKRTEGSFIIETCSSISLYNAVKPEVTEEMEEEANRLLNIRQFCPISKVKSDAVSNYSRVSVKGKIVCCGTKEAKTNLMFLGPHRRLAVKYQTLSMNI